MSKKRTKVNGWDIALVLAIVAIMALIALGCKKEGTEDTLYRVLKHTQDSTGMYLTIELAAQPSVRIEATPDDLATYINTYDGVVYDCYLTPAGGNRPHVSCRNQGGPSQVMHHLKTQGAEDCSPAP